MSLGPRAANALHLAVALGRQCRHFFSLDHRLKRHAQPAGLRVATL